MDESVKLKVRLQYGFSIIPVLIVIAVVAVVSGAFFYFNSELADVEKASMPTATSQSLSNIEIEVGTEENRPVSGGAGEKNMESKMGEVTITDFNYKGKVLTGSKSPLLEFDKSDYDVVLGTDKLVILYFYANWCPICKAEFPKMEQAFNELASDKAIGLKRL